MCFSPEASFIASGTLVAAGAAALKVAPKEKRVLAIIPLFFGIQQFFEGVQWLYLERGSVSLVAAYCFLFFAFLLWPFYVPLVMCLIDPARRVFLRWFLVLGSSVSLIYSYGLLAYPLTVQITGNCVDYGFTVPFGLTTGIAYLVAVLGALWLASESFLRWLGVIVGLSALVTGIFYRFAFASVWCFFAAVISVLIYWHLRRK